MKKFLLVICMLATCIVASLSISNGVNAQSNDIAIFLHNGSSVYSYRLSDNLSHLSDRDKVLRGVMYGVKRKIEIYDQVVQLGFSKMESMNYVLSDFSNFFNSTVAEVDSPFVDSTVRVVKGTFVYTQSSNGKKVDEEKLINQIISQFRNGANVINLEVPTMTIAPKFSEQALRANSKLKANFATDFSSSSVQRASNVMLALSKLDGLTLLPDEQLSFNEVVGQRTVENGFLEAKIIVDGEYVDGIGGGVCQVSTTLYNACLISNLEIVKQRQHSLLSSYVEPSFDAMVNSSSSDLIVRNNTNYPICISTSGTNGRASVKIYGVANEYEIRRRSVVTSKVVLPVKEIIDTKGEFRSLVEYADETFILTHGVPSIRSVGYLDYYKNSQLVKSQLIRTNSYKGIAEVVVRGAKTTPKGLINSDIGI